MSATASLTSAVVTHEITNQAPELKDTNLYTTDPALVRAVARGGAQWHDAALRAQGAVLGSEACIRMAEDANTYLPELKTHSRTGERIDVVKFHPSWHEAMAINRRHGVANLPFADARPSAWTAYGAAQYIHSQFESGSQCPTTMTFACIPVLQKAPYLWDTLKDQLLSTDYDARDIPLAGKRSITIGMGMTEKQGGSDVRTNTTRASALRGEGPGADYLLTGHKWFFSAPMCDAHLVLARTENGVSCFFVPRWQPDGKKNPIYIQRLKSKVGNQSNSSSEVEFHQALGTMVGQEGRGIATIIEMANHTRLNCALSSAGFMRQGFSLALHHAKHRQAFGKHLIDQPLMTRVLADMAIETEAAMLLSMDLADKFRPDTDDLGRAWRRILTPAAKFWNCKRAVEMTGEAMEVLGGNGYVSDGPMGRLFREAPVNSIWEGSGNVMCLDVLRAIGRSPEDMQRVLAHMMEVGGKHAPIAQNVDWMVRALKQAPEALEADGRRFTVKLALTAQACLMLQHGGDATRDAFMATRFDADWGAVMGISAASVDAARVLAEAFYA